MALRKMDNPVINLKTSESSREKREKMPFSLYKKQKKTEKRKAIFREVPKKEKILEFPDGFLWGTSTSAYQIEGNIRNDWSIWEKSYKRINNLQKNGKNIKDFTAGQACDSYNRYSEDFDLALALNNNIVRFGIEWSRIEPKIGTWSVKEIQHYHNVFKAAKERGLKTVVTLWHWTNPIWLSRINGWTNPETVKHFLNYTNLIIKEYGSYIDYWITLNEPMIHTFNGYVIGKFPPGDKNIIKGYKVLNNLAQAHNQAYKLIHKHFPKARVGFTKLRNYFEPANRWNPVEQIISRTMNFFSNELFINKTKKYLDFVGIDYYFHDRIVWYPPFIKNKNIEVTDTGWEIYPEGIYHVLKSLQKLKKPIIIMENGIADQEDKYREVFIKEHLYYIHKAIQEGVPVKGYLYWSLLDNFEWSLGWEPKFGLFSVDRETFKRRPRPSAFKYADICKNNKVSVVI